MHLAITAITLALTSSVNAFFRLPCAKPVVDGRLDPIVSSGRPSSHAHTVMGGNNISLKSTFADMRASNCSTCKVKDDLSAYWIPMLYYEFPNKTYKSVSHGGMLVYYLQRNGPGETVQAFPDGLRMLTGDPYARNDTGTDASKAISWLCLNYAINPADPQTPGITKTNCPEGLRAQVFFPSCWNGVDLDSPDHSSHMAYPDGIDNGSCPPSHPIRLVSIFYEVWFSVAQFNQLNDGGRFVVSTGDPTGFSLHGDFLSGWDRSVLSRAVATCTDPSGVIENCGVFSNEGRFFTDDENNACSAKDPVPSEDVDALLPYLPGCIAVTHGPARASPNNFAPGCTIDGNTPAAAAPPPSSSTLHSTPIPLSSSSTLTSTSTRPNVNSSDDILLAPGPHSDSTNTPSHTSPTPHPSSPSGQPADSCGNHSSLPSSPHHHHHHTASSRRGFVRRRKH